MDTKQSFLHVFINFPPLQLHSLADIPQKSSLAVYLSESVHSSSIPSPFLPFPTNYIIPLFSLAVTLSYSCHSFTFPLAVYLPLLLYFFPIYNDIYKIIYIISIILSYNISISLFFYNISIYLCFSLILYFHIMYIFIYISITLYFR
jgi:hypothetical protein